MQLGPKTQAAIAKYKELQVISKEINEKVQRYWRDYHEDQDALRALTLKLMQDPNVLPEWRIMAQRCETLYTSTPNPNDNNISDALYQAKSTMVRTFLEEHVDDKVRITYTIRGS